MRISDLRWNDWNREHIARHGVTPAEVEEVVWSGSFHAVRMRRHRYGLIGQTDFGRHLTIVVDRRNGDVFTVVTARPLMLPSEACSNERVRDAEVRP